MTCVLLEALVHPSHEDKALQNSFIHDQDKNAFEFQSLNGQINKVIFRYVRLPNVKQTVCIYIYKEYLLRQMEFR